MEISKGMLDHYIGFATSFWFNDHDVPPDDVTEYKDLIEQAKKDAENRGDLPVLCKGLEYLLCHEDISLENHGGLYPYEDKEVREIVSFMRSVIFPQADKLNCYEVKNISLVHTSKFEWWDMRAGREHHRYYSTGQDGKPIPISEQEWQRMLSK